MGDDWPSLPHGFYHEVMDRAFASEDMYRQMDEAAFEQQTIHYAAFFEALNLPMPGQSLELYHLLRNLSDILNSDDEE